jgi:hypothetical protein
VPSANGSAPAIISKVLETCVPSRDTDPTITTAISAAIRAYSIAVAPSSELKKLMCFLSSARV